MNETRDTATARKKNPSLRNQAYESLKRGILNCDLKPGEAVTVTELAEELGIGRTPVIQAVDRLMLEGLVEVMPRKGVVVSPISLDDLVEIIEVRLLNEIQAARWAAERISKQQLDDMRDNLNRMHKASAARDVATLIMLDSQFHSLISAATGNESLAELLGRLHDRSLRFWTLSLKMPHRNDRVCEQHAAIIDALQSGSADKAEQAMRDHIKDFQSSILAQVVRD